MEVPFRPQALARAGEPERLETMIQVTGALGWAAFWGLAALLAAAIAWGLWGRVPVEVSGSGLLLPPGGVVNVAAPAAGQVGAVLVAEGQSVRAGQMVARIDRPDLRDRVTRDHQRLAALQAALQDWTAAATAEAAAWVREESSRRARLAAALAACGGRKGATPPCLEAQARESALDLDALRRRAARADGRRRREALVAAAAQRLALDEAAWRRATLIEAPRSGRVAEVMVDPGAWVAPGAALLRLLPGAEGSRPALVAVLYVRPQDGKKIHPGMEVELEPATTRPTRDGFLIGRVRQVADMPASRRSMLRVFKNGALVDQLMRSGPPYRVIVAPETDSSTVSGFAWSSGRGPDRLLEAGTTTRARVVVGHVPLIGLVVPGLDTVLGGGEGGS